MNFMGQFVAEDHEPVLTSTGIKELSENLFLFCWKKKRYSDFVLNE